MTRSCLTFLLNGCWCASTDHGPLSCFLVILVHLSTFNIQTSQPRESGYQSCKAFLEHQSLLLDSKTALPKDFSYLSSNLGQKPSRCEVTKLAVTYRFAHLNGHISCRCNPKTLSTAARLGSCYLSRRVARPPDVSESSHLLVISRTSLNTGKFAR
ncbi:hypothetical protein BKA67DRAFT_426108 [Truncatella angustata]|uniref:Secreted protein n=1 Tax=Truncatella angustata TaxID=152316 RepID=A0A9P8UDB5_9PEZI|nr:uncharacterized protein BKA67DRAFT_426108 [Truncatella angustata]KAH6647092.1 hypothetical protein BKA67DRAFT_426108 [Truncatella angustata]